MNLSEAMFQHAYPGKFRLLQRVIYTCFKPIQTWLGEIIFTQLAQGYVDGGSGFNHEIAGRSNASSYQKLSTKQWEMVQMAADWTLVEQNISGLKPAMEKNSGEEKARLKAIGACLEADIAVANAKAELSEAMIALYNHIMDHP